MTGMQMILLGCWLFLLGVVAYAVIDWGMQ